VIVVVNKFGSKVSKKGDCLEIKSGNETREICVLAVTDLILSTHCLISTDVLELCAKNDIRIQFLSGHGTPFCEINSFEGGESPIIKRKQLALSTNVAGVDIIRNLLVKKLENRMKQLKELSKNRPAKSRETIKIALLELGTYVSKIALVTGNNVADIRDCLQGYEGSAGRVYFKTISDLLPNEYRFSGRSYMPAKDMYNAMLNYAYGILYGSMKSDCYLARLDPYIGIMHADIYNKPTLVYDLVEAYRYYPEKVVFSLFSKRRVKDDFFIKKDNGFWFAEEGKKLLIADYYKEMLKPVKENRKTITVREKIKHDIVKIAKTIAEV